MQSFARSRVRFVTALAAGLWHISPRKRCYRPMSVPVDRIEPKKGTALCAILPAAGTATQLPLAVLGTALTCGCRSSPPSFFSFTPPPELGSLRRVRMGNLRRWCRERGYAEREGISTSAVLTMSCRSVASSCRGHRSGRAKRPPIAYVSARDAAKSAGAGYVPLYRHHRRHPGLTASSAVRNHPVAPRRTEDGPSLSELAHEN